jgi:hypothetical protein
MRGDNFFKVDHSEHFAWFDCSKVRAPQADEPDEYLTWIKDLTGKERRVWVVESERRIYCPVSGDDMTIEFDFMNGSNKEVSSNADWPRE